MIQGLSCIFMSFLSSPRLAVTHPKSQTTAFHSGVLHAFLFTPRCSCSSPLLNTTVVYCLCSLENHQRHSGSLDFFLPPTMLRSLFGWDSSSSKGFLVFLSCCQIQMLEPCSCGLLSRQFCSVLSFPSFCAVDRSSPKHLGNLCQLHCSYQKYILLSLLQAWFPLSSIPMMSFLTFQLYSYLSRLF